MCKSDYLYSEFGSRSENESLARVLVAAFVARLDPTLEELDDVKTAVSEAVTNAIIHGYPKTSGPIRLRCQLDGPQVTIHVEDEGIGIADVKKAMEPLYTSCPGEERSGMGFTMMQAFMDRVRVDSVPGKGTRVTMTKSFRPAEPDTAEPDTDGPA
jgi:stage II sporulation protein AB (anti-sigma F factor)